MPTSPVQYHAHTSLTGTLKDIPMQSQALRRVSGERDCRRVNPMKILVENILNSYRFLQLRRTIELLYSVLQLQSTLMKICCVLPSCTADLHS